MTHDSHSWPSNVFYLQNVSRSQFCHHCMPTCKSIHHQPSIYEDSTLWGYHVFKCLGITSKTCAKVNKFLYVDCTMEAMRKKENKTEYRFNVLEGIFNLQRLINGTVFQAFLFSRTINFPLYSHA